MLTSFRARLIEPISAESLAVFRMMFGGLLLVDWFRYTFFGWIDRFFVEPVFMFKYYGFEWVQTLPEPWIHIHFALWGLTALAVTLGLFYRIAIVAHLIIFTWLFLLDQALYLNHFYFVILLNIVLCLVPAHACWSIDAKRKPLAHKGFIARWHLLAFLYLLEIFLLYAGIVKINHDWLNLQPLTMWLGIHSDWPILGELFQKTWVVAVASYGTVILHCLGAPLLLYRRTRMLAFIMYCSFHTMNHFLFQIGIFPWLTIGATLLFFDPDWPSQFGRWLAAKFSLSLNFIKPTPTGSPFRETRAIQFTWAFLALFLLANVLVPLRHWVYPGEVAWNEQGHRFSWRMKLRDKRGRSYFVVKDPQTNETWKVRPHHYLSHKQSHKMNISPDMILQFAHFLAEEYRSKGVQSPEVYAHVRMSLNGRRPSLLIDPERNLSQVTRHLGHNDWILPLKWPLRREYL